MFGQILSFDELKQESFIIENILWDVEPRDLMEPRHKVTEAGTQIRGQIKGYVFYIDTMEEPPRLFLMRHTAMDFGETAAKIEEMPQELLIEAVEENKDKSYFKMYPINSRIKEWLKKEFNLP